MWKTNLNIEVKLYEAEWEVFIEKRKTGNYFIARDGWVGDYTHPMTMLDIFTEKNGNNHARYSSKKFDNLILEARKEKDSYKSMEILHNAEKELIGEDMAVIPIAFYESKMACQLYIKGVRKAPTGITYFDRAYVEDKETK